MGIETILILLIFDAIICSILGAMVGSARNASGPGVLLGLLFGPLGVIATLARISHHPYRKRLPFVA
ncbi:MAG TPA: hypothetical protein VIH42_13690 [Thermoguttaceae bacterium]